MEESGRRTQPRKGKMHGTAAAEEVETWRSPLPPEGQDHGRGHGRPTKKGQGWPSGTAPRRKPHHPSPGSSPEAQRFGHSPSQREGFRIFPSPDGHRRKVSEDNWRQRPQQPKDRWKRDAHGEKRRPRRQETKSESGQDQVFKDAPDSIAPSAGGRPKPKGSRKILAIASCVTIKDLQRLCLAEEESDSENLPSVKEKSGISSNIHFNCDECRANLDNFSQAVRHVREKPHKRKAKVLRERTLLLSLPAPTKEQITAISASLAGVVQEAGLSDQDVEQRQKMVTLLEEVIKPVLPESTLRLYGSSCTKFGFKDSDVNIDIQFPSHLHQPDVLLLVKECLSTSGLFVSVEADFHTRVPVVVCKENDSGLICKVSAGNEGACLTSAYLAALANQEPRLLPLIIGFRHWAKICRVDQMDEGGLPPYCFALMVISFLQQRKERVLPSYFESTNLPLSKLGGFSLTAVESDHVLWEWNVVQKDPPNAASASTDAAVRKGKAPLVLQNQTVSVEVGQLWVELLRFYSLEYQIPDKVISVRTNGHLWRDTKDWPWKRIAIEDPFAVKRNVARTVNSQLMFEYFMHCLKTTYKYFALPPGQHPARNRGGTLQDPQSGSAQVNPSDTSSLQSEGTGVQRRRAGTEGSPEEALEHSDCVIEEELEEEEEEVSDSDAVEDDEDDDDEDIELDESRWDPLDDELFHFDGDLNEVVLSDSEVSVEEVEDEEETASSLEDEDEIASALQAIVQSPKDLPKYGAPEQTAAKNGLNYVFSKHFFTNGKCQALVCSLCKRDGHLRRDCPEEFKKVELEPLPPMTPKFLRTLNDVCEQCYRDFAPDDIEEKVREYVLLDLETFIRRQITGARLKLFGSSKNGFGFKQSDLDICLMFDDYDTAEDLDCIGVIEHLAKVLRKHHGLKNILPIITAKVPIVKFYHTKTGLEGDISLYNTLALHNTQLLATYASIDARVRILCYVMKVFSKVCDIGDASRGSLSSYAYTLMVLFYLQQRNPPVIPVLQEIFDGQRKPEVLVDGWNVYFFKDVENLYRHWPQYKKNKESVGELWLGLLRFYTEVFDFREHVICTRKKAPLTTFKKQWTSKYIVIEDPFDLNHNLGAGLSRRMTNFIMKAFINGRRVFGSPVLTFPPEYSNKMEYFFDPEVLTEGELAPNDRCCRICGKIGHFMKDCPMRKKSRARRENSEGFPGGREEGERARSPREHTPGKEERWRRKDERSCFLCGSYAHLKRECPQYRSPAGGSKTESGSFSSSPSNQLRIIREKEKQSSQLETKRKPKAKRVILGPQAGSLVSRHMSGNQAASRRSPIE